MYKNSHRYSKSSQTFYTRCLNWDFVLYVIVLLAIMLNNWELTATLNLKYAYYCPPSTRIELKEMWNGQPEWVNLFVL